MQPIDGPHRGGAISRPRDVYVTGTDTGVGKTMACTVLLHALHARGLRAVGMKPVASGCTHTAQGWRNDDALALQAASDPAPDYDDVNPYPLPMATAPQIAARAAGVEVALAPILAAHARLRAQADAVVVEGVGGWLAPLADALEQADVARALRLPVILVVGLRLGCLSHARLGARAIVADGCELRGWIASTVDPEFGEQDDYLALLRAALPAPCLGVLPHASQGTAAELSRHLALSSGIGPVGASLGRDAF